MMLPVMQTPVGRGEGNAIDPDACSARHLAKRFDHTEAGSRVARLTTAQWMLIALAAIVGLIVGATGRAAENLSAGLGPEWQQLPDWRGVWYLEQPLVFTGPDAAVIAKEATPAGGAANAFEHGVRPGSYFKGAPYKPEYQKVYDERIAKAREQSVVEDPVENCYTPHGMPRLMGAAPGAAEFFVTPKQTWIIFDYMNQTRRIYTDGRGKPGEDLQWPRVMGYSVGRWEGQTLIAETFSMKEGVYDRTGAPHSDQLHLTERISRTDANTITVESTIEDPVMFTGPWRVTRHFKKSSKEWESVPGYYCPYDGKSPQ